MKLKFLAVVCTLAAAAQAHAAAPVPGVDAAAATIRISGSSAQLNSLQAIADNLFQAGNITHITDAATGSAAGSNYRAYFGKLAVAVGTLPVGANVLIVDRAAGGSFQGVGPLARAQSIAFMTVDGTCSSTGAAYPAPSYRCTNTGNAVPDLGVSDEEPNLFSGLNLPAGQSALNATELNNINAQTEYNVVLGIAATNNLYAQLSSLTRAQIAAILAGNYTDWSQLGLADGPIVVETRAAGSGTKAGANAYFLSAPCALAYNGGLAPAAAQGDPVNFTTFTVVDNSSSGNVISGLNAAFSKGARAIGVLGREFNPGVGENWKWLAIDGIDIGATTFVKDNVVNGAYDYFVSQSIQYRNKTVNGVPAPSGNTAALINKIIAKSGDPAVIIGNPANPTVKGILLDPTIGDPTDPTYGAFVTKGTRFNNTCSPLQLAF